MLSIVIGTCNRRERLEACLDALVGKIRTEHEIIVIDAGSTDGTIEFLRKRSGVRAVFDGKLIGQAQSLNGVLRQIKSKYFCWLSDDNIVVDGMLDIAADILEQDEDIGMVALKTADVTGPYVNEPYIGGIWPSGVLNCNQGMSRTELFQRLGGFDEEFRDYGIDSDLTTKVLLAGYKVVMTKDVAVQHYRDHEAVTWTNNDERQRRTELARERYKNKYAMLIQYHSGSLRGRLDTRVRLEALRLVKGVYFLAGKIRKSSANRRGYYYRDYQNILSSRFINAWDLVANRRRPYYLVQKISPKIIEQVNQYQATGWALVKKAADERRV